MDWDNRIQVPFSTSGPRRALFAGFRLEFSQAPRGPSILSLSKTTSSLLELGLSESLVFECPTYFLPIRVLFSKISAGMSYPPSVFEIDAIHSVPASPSGKCSSRGNYSTYASHDVFGLLMAVFLGSQQQIKQRRLKSARLVGEYITHPPFFTQR